VALPLVGMRGVHPLGIQLGLRDLFEGRAGELQAVGFGAVEGDAGGGGSVVEAGGADVGDAVAVGVGAAGSGIPGDVDAEGVWGAEAGALANENDGELGVEDGADVVGDGDACLGGDAKGAEGLAWGQRGMEGGEEGDGVAADGCGGEAVGDDEEDVAGGRVEESGGGGGQGAAEVWAAEVGGAVEGCAGEGEDGDGEGRDFRAQAVGELLWVERGVDGVASLGVGELEVEDLCGGEAYAGAAQCDAGRRVAAERRGRGGGRRSGLGYLQFFYFF
jgi:hypothetical protein